MKKKNLGIAMLVLAGFVAIGMVYGLGKWWFVLDTLVIVVNGAGGIMLLSGK